MSNPIPYGDAPVAARITSPGRAIVAAQVSVAQTEFPATVQVGTVTELHPRQSPTVTNSGTSEAAVLDFGLPRAWGIGVRNTTTLEPGSDATVTKVEQGNNVLLDFGIPKGEKGDTGEPGADATAIYGDPVTVDKGGTGKANGNRLAYYCECSQSVADNAITITGEIDGYADAIGNVIFVQVANQGNNTHLANLVITSGGETVATYALRMGSNASLQATPPSSATTMRKMVYGFIVTAEGVATAIQQVKAQADIVCTNNPIATFANPMQYENLTVAGSMVDNYTKERYAISNACTNMVRLLPANVDAIRPKYFDIVICKGALWARYCDVLGSSAISSGGHYMLSQGDLRSCFGDLGVVYKFTRMVRYIGTVTYTVVETGADGSQTVDIGEGESVQIASTTATLDMSEVTSNLEARITFTDSDGALTNVKITKYWAFPLTSGYTSLACDYSDTGLTITRDGGWSQAALDATIALDTLTTSTTFSIPREHNPLHEVTAWAVCSDGGMVSLTATPGTSTGTLTVSLAPNTTTANGTLRASLIWPSRRS